VAGSLHCRSAAAHAWRGCQECAPDAGTARQVAKPATAVVAAAVHGRLSKLDAFDAGSGEAVTCEAEGGGCVTGIASVKTCILPGSMPVCAMRSQQHTRRVLV